MRREFYTYLMLAVATTLLVSGCDQAPEPQQALAAAEPAIEPVVDEPSAADVEAAADEVAKFHYSPFYVELKGAGEFDIITFKDVGLKRSTTDPNDPLLEVIAESLSYSISESDLGYGPAYVSYAEELADPASHKACGQNHLYVDVWKSRDSRYGYSLWSGCGESDNFAWKELEIPAKGSNLADEVEPLTRSITESIAEAKASQCFQKHC